MLYLISLLYLLFPLFSFCYTSLFSLFPSLIYLLSVSYSSVFYIISIVPPCFFVLALCNQSVLNLTYLSLFSLSYSICYLYVLTFYNIYFFPFLLPCCLFIHCLSLLLLFYLYILSWSICVFTALGSISVVSICSVLSLYDFSFFTRSSGCHSIYALSMSSLYFSVLSLFYFPLLSVLSLFFFYYLTLFSIFSL